jgi:hypothetical protein
VIIAPSVVVDRPPEAGISAHLIPADADESAVSTYAFDALDANFDAVIALVAILSVVIEPVAMVCSPTIMTHCVPLYFHVVVSTVNSSLRDGEFG